MGYLYSSVSKDISGVMQPGGGGGGSEMELSCDGVSNSQLSNNYRSLGIFTPRLCSVF